MTKRSRDVVTDEDVLALTQHVVSAQIKRFWQKKCKLVIPVTQPHRPRAGSHFHTFSELFIQLSGIGRQHLPEKVLHQGPLQMCLVPRLTAHVGQVVRQPCHILVISALHGRITLLLSRDDEANVAACVTSPLADRLEQCCSDIIECSRGDNKSAMQGYTLATLGMLLEAIQGRAAGTSEPHKIMQCRHLIQDGIGDKSLSVGRLAKTVNCSRDYLSHLFHAHTGKRLVEYINQQRIARACELLDHTDLNVSETAIACGYPDPSYFTWLFRKTVGMTPKGYRQRYKSTAK